MSDSGMRRPLGKLLLAAWRRLCYQLTYHRLLSIPLKHWIWLLIVLPPLVAWIGRIEWAWAIALSTLGAAALIGAERARRSQYIVFAPADPGDRPARGNAPADGTARPADRTERPADGTARPADGTEWPAHPYAPESPEPENPLQVDEPLRCWASGLLGVEGKGRALACERASISYVRTREHVLMAQVRRTRFLLLAPVSKADVGYWYAFFHPHQVQTARLGTVYYGFSARPGLELRYLCQEDGRGVQLYLAFEDARARQRLIDDLRRDVSEDAF